MNGKLESSIIEKTIGSLTSGKVISTIIVLGIIAYFSSLFNSFAWDDYPQLINYQLNHSLLNIVPIFANHSHTFYRPFSDLVLAGMYNLFGQTAFWYHLFQLIIHVTISILIYFLFKKYFSNILSFFLSIIFLSHPINVESVAYISAIQSNISLFLGLISLFVILSNKISTKLKYSLLFLLILLSSFSKESGLLFIVLIPCFMALGKLRSYAKKEYLLTVISLLLVVFVYIYFHFFFNLTIVDSHKNILPIPIMNSGLSIRLLTLPKIIYYYLLTFIFPKDLAVSQYWIVNTMNFNDFYFPLFIDAVFLIGLILGGIFIYKHNLKKFYIYTFFAIWLFLNWAISWQIIPLDMTVADRWFYAPMIGLLGTIGVLVSEIKIHKEYLIRVTLLLLIFTISILLSRTFVRVQNWYDGVILFNHDITASNDNYNLEYLLGYTYLTNKNYDEAKPHLDKSIKLAPEYWENWLNLGVYYESKGKIDESINAFARAISNNPYYYPAYLNTARIYYYYNRLALANKFLEEKALVVFPQDAYFWSLKGVIDYKLGNKQGGTDEVLKAYNISHDNGYLSIYNLMQDNQDLSNLR